MIRLKIKLYYLIVNRVSGIQKRYQLYRNKDFKILHRIKSWCYLVGLNISYYLFFQRRLKDVPEYNPDRNKKIPIKCSESSLSKRESPEDLVNKLLNYDVISFDVFDTLILRPFSKPSDLFFLLAERFNYLDFERIRTEMEGKARLKKYKESGHYEVTLEEIWLMIEDECGIHYKEGMRAELELEYEYCFANPYFAEVMRILRERNKEFICISDMYLNANHISNLLIKCGYEMPMDLFVSSDYGCSKGTGGLYEIFLSKYGLDKKYIHVGDNHYSDVQMAKKYKIQTIYYRNVNEAGKPYRAEDMSVITGSIYRGIVNAHIHNGLHKFSKEYELGFIYGGIFVLGYCQFIHEYVKKNEIDKILFLARDGDILHQVYQMLYPEESGKDKCEYVLWSRLAATKMSASRFKYDYFRRFLYHKVNQNYSIQEVFVSMELEDMLDDLIIYTSQNNLRLTKLTKLTNRNVEMIKEYLKSKWSEVLCHYDEQMELGKEYYQQVLEGCKKVVAVDVGWAGSGAVALQEIVKEIWNIPCEIIGLLAGTNTIHNVEPNASEAHLNSGKLVSYVFSQVHNRDIWKIHNLNKGHNIIIENLLQSNNDHFRKFSKMIIVDNKLNYKVNDLQTGIVKFVNIYTKYFNKQKFIISGLDAYLYISILQKSDYILKTNNIMGIRHDVR